MCLPLTFPPQTEVSRRDPCPLDQLRRRNTYPLILHSDGRVTVRPNSWSYPVYTFPSAEAAWSFFSYDGGNLSKSVEAVWPGEPHYIPS